MRRTLLVLATAVALAVPASASAAITPTNDPGTLAGAIADGRASGAVTGASFEIAPPSTNASAAVADGALAGFPLAGASYAILTTGTAALADDPPPAGSTSSQDGFASTAGGTQSRNRGPSAQDVTVLRISLNVPPAANCLTLGFRFLSEEYPEFVGTGFNDGFIAELDTSDWTTNADSTISAGHNFAFDDAGNVISINTSSMTAEEGAGTIYDGATPQLSAASPLTAGAHTLYLSIFDQGAGYDSAVFVDRLTFLATEPGGCVRGAQADETPPAVSIAVNSSSADDSTPTFSGSAGDAPGDGSAVTVKVYGGGAPVGAPVQTLTANRNGTGWSVDAAPLSPGTYTAQAEQADIAGNTGFSVPSSFNVATPPPPPPVVTRPAPVPVLGKSVVAGVVSGKIRIKGRTGKFRTLGADETIPLGSTIDATKGRVRLTSAAGSGGKTQTGDFYQGAFVITQTRGSKPVTQLALSGKLSCKVKGKKATTSARKKKVRRLWGDGKGRFRTKGKYGAATVRGTKWLTEDRCGSTLVRVKRGTVAVRDFAKRKTVLVKKGKSYLARAKGAPKRR